MVGFGMDGHHNVTVSEKTDHFTQISDVEMLVPRCSTLFTLYNGEVRIAIAYTVFKLHTPRYGHPRMIFSRNGTNL